MDSQAGRELGIAEYYFDEAGFSLNPVVPYAWPPAGDTIRLPGSGSKRFNVLGFYSKTEKPFFRHVEGPVNSQTVISVIDAFVDQ